MKYLQTQKNKRDFPNPKKIRISKISDPKNKPSPPVNFFSSTLPGDILPLKRVKFEIFACQLLVKSKKISKLILFLYVFGGF